MTTGERIKQAREEAGLSQAKLAERVGVTHHCISKWETDYRNPKFGTLVRIADALGVSVSKLVGGNVFTPAVDVVLCKNCTRYKQYNGTWCAHWGARVKPEDYCSRGVRRGENG